MTSTQALKTQLFSSLSKQGFHDDIKKQVRAKIIQRLKQKNIIQPKNQQKQLFKRVISSLIVQQLQLNQFTLSQSIYSIQSGFQSAHMTRNQLIQLLTFKPNQIKSNQSILQYILRRKQPFVQNTLQNVQIQTNAQQIGYTLQQKLMMIDQQYRINLAQKQNINKNNIFDRKKLQLQFAQKYKKQMDLFKQFQTHKIKIKVSEQWRLKFQDYSNQLAEQYRRKYDLLRKKDKQLNQEYIQKHNQLNMKINQSQKIIQQKIEMLDMKNTTIQTQMQNLQKSKKDFQDQTLKRQKQLNQKMRQYDNLSLNLKQKIKYEVNLAKLTIQQEYQDRQAQSLRRKKVIDQDYGKLMGIKDSIEIVEKQNVRLSEQNTNLRNHLTSLQKQLKSTVMQMGNKVDRIQVLKDDLTQMTQEKKSIEQRLKQENKKSKRYESEIISMRQQLDKLRAKQNRNMNLSNLQDSSVELDNNTEFKKIDEVNKRLQRLKNQRKKDIQKFKLQL